MNAFDLKNFGEWILFSVAGVLRARHIQHREGAPEAVRAEHGRRGGRGQGSHHARRRALPRGAGPHRHRE